MRHLELHILQSVPVSCLNRDDLGSPKTAYFGGVKRARVSSQCWKRAVREFAKETAPELFQGRRTRLIVAPLAERLRTLGAEDPEGVALRLADALAGINTRAVKAGRPQVKTLFFTSPLELEAVAQAYVQSKDAGKAVAALKKVRWTDAADIALFGRMVAQDHSLTVEGAAMFGHALSTHKAEAELDFYTAVDDLQPDDENGAGMMGTLEFHSAVFYRFAALNLDMLADAAHLGALLQEQRRTIAEHFVEAVVKAVPGARRNSMNAAVLPGCVLAVLRERGHPIQLVNAFETPVKGPGLMAASVRAMKEELAALKRRWGLESAAEYELSPETDTTFAELLAGVATHVR